MSLPRLIIIDSESTNIRLAKRKLNTLVSSIMGVSALGISAIQDRSKLESYEASLNRAKDAWEKFQRQWFELDEIYLKAKEDDKFPSEQDEAVYSALSNEILEAETHLLRIKRQEEERLRKESHSKQEGNQIRNPHLPRISLPSFGGELLKWSSYRDTFKALIHEDRCLSNIEKFNYLKSSLRSEAASLISKLPVTSEAYPQAWSIICKTYDNSRVLASHYIKRVLDYIPSHSKPTLDSYMSYFAGVVDNIESFKLLEIPGSTEFLLSLLALRALDKDTRSAFELANLNKELPTSDDVFGFVRERVKAIRLSTDQETSATREPNPANRRGAGPSKWQKKYEGKAFYTSETRDATKPSVRKDYLSAGKKSQSVPTKSQFKTQFCSYCQSAHYLGACLKFQEASPEHRAQFIAAWKGCINCLREGHKVEACKSNYNCIFCNKRHHRLLHRGINKEPKRACPNDPDQPGGSALHTRESSIHVPGQVLLGTAEISIKSLSGRTVKARALLDSCSEYSFITTKISKRLGCRVTPFKGRISGLGGVTLGTPAGYTICSVIANDAEYPIDAVIVDRITALTPSKPVPQTIVKQLDCLNLADANFDQPGPIDVLIGADMYPAFLTGTTAPIDGSGIYLLHTVFGNVVTGKYRTENPSNGKIIGNFTRKKRRRRAMARRSCRRRPPGKGFNSPSRFD